MKIKMLTQRRLIPKSDKQEFIDRLTHGKPDPILVGPNITLRIDENLNLTTYVYEEKHEQS